MFKKNKDDYEILEEIEEVAADEEESSDAELSSDEMLEQSIKKKKDHSKFLEKMASDSVFKKFFIVETALIVAALIAIPVSLVVSKKNAEAPTPTQIPPKVTERVNNGTIGIYDFLLQGEHAVMTVSGQTKEFDFDDGKFFGYTSWEDDDFGTYRLTLGENGETILEIDTSGAFDRYEVSLSESKNVVLKSLDTNDTYTILD